MLFLSRRFAVDTYGVADTDDDSETIIKFSDLRSLSEVPNLEIKGLRLWYNGSSLAASILPYQDPATVSALQLKTSIAHHVDVITYKDIITGIKIHSELISTPVTLRLSNYGRECSAFLFRGYNQRSRTKKLELVLDDKLILDEKSFFLGGMDNGGSIGTSGIGVVFNLTEVTDNMIANNVYTALCNKNVLEVNMSVIDHKERKNIAVSQYSESGAIDLCCL